MTQRTGWPIRRSELARRAGCNSETVRYYEDVGLLPMPRRNAAGHRVYDEPDLNRLRFICRARDLGFALTEVRELVALAEEAEDCCADVEALTLRQLEAVRGKIAALQRMDRALSALAAQCRNRDGRACPVVESLSEEPD